MEKRYQIFVSSTFADLVDERQAALRAILELDHMPAGMELFPAVDDTVWQLIKDVIDGSDYYVLIIGGRYGSLDETGLSFTEKEYDYAVSSKKPIIPLLHGNPDNLPRGKTDTQTATWEKLKAFRLKIEKLHTCVYWNTAEDLKAKVIIGLTATMKRHPAIGWIRADQVPPEATVTELLSLRRKITELEANADATSKSPPQDSEHLQQGNDTFNIWVEFIVRKFTKTTYVDTPYTGSICPSWNEIFAAVAPSMILESSESELKRMFLLYFERIAKEDFNEDPKNKGLKLNKFNMKNEDLDTCIVQLRALGLIRESQRQRSLKDTEAYWTLTPYGDHLMVQLRALHKRGLSDDESGYSANLPGDRK